MIVNPKKYQAIVLKRGCRMDDSFALNISNQTINSENFVKLLGIEINNKLSCDKHLFKRASNQLNVVGKIQKWINIQEKEMILNSFFISNFNYCPFV